MFERLILASVFVHSTVAFGVADDQHVSKIKASAEGFTIPNAHWLEKDKILRSNSPLTVDHIEQIKINKINHVIVFKSFSNPAAKNELLKLYKDGGFNLDNVRFIDFPWKDITNYQTACAQIIEALKTIKTQRSYGVLIHCTVGEDRTGLLSALIRQLKDGWSKEKSFRDELCAYGYANANPLKDDFVKYKIHQALSPLFEFFSESIQNKSISWENINPKICNSLDSIIKTYRDKYRWCPL